MGTDTSEVDFSKEYCCREHTLRNVIKTKLGLIGTVRDRLPSCVGSSYSSRSYASR